MKKYFTSLFALLVIVGTTQAVAQTETTPKEETGQEQPKTQFQDLNANGIDDAKETLENNSAEKKKRKRVKFIDTDGDGICDGRASGAGLKLRSHGNNSGKQSHKGKK